MTNGVRGTGSDPGCKNMSDQMDQNGKQSEMTSLYRYRGIRYGLMEVRDEYLHYSSPLDFNDPFDSMYSMQDAERFLDDPELGSIRPDLYRLMVEYAKNSFSDNLRAALSRVRICCFSAVNDSLSMWSHYSDNHRGICIEYGVWELERNGIRPHKVAYSQKMMVRPFRDTSEEHKLAKAILNKSREYAIEREYRDIKVVDDAWSDNREAVSCIKSVSLGCRYHHNDGESASGLLELVEVCRNRDIPVYVMEQDSDEFRLNRVQLFKDETIQEQMTSLNFDVFRERHAGNGKRRRFLIQLSGSCLGILS